MLLVARHKWYEYRVLNIMTFDVQNIARKMQHV